MLSKQKEGSSQVSGYNYQDGVNYCNYNCYGFDLEGIRALIVRITDLILWQWKPTMIAGSVWEDDQRYNSTDDGRIISEIVKKYREHGRNCRCIPPIRITRDLGGFDWLSEKAMKQYYGGKWVVWDGFHRIYAARRMGYETIKARVW